MSKFTDLGRRNIADAIGHSIAMSGTDPSLVISTTIGNHNSLHITTGGNNSNGVTSRCLNPISCAAIYGIAAQEGYGGFFTGGRGAVVYGNDDYMYGLSVGAEGEDASGATIYSSSYRGAEIESHSSASYSLHVDHVPTGAYGLATEHGAYINGNLIVTGSKSGYVVDIMQNVGPDPLQPGDVVTIAGTSPPVVGDIPVITVVKASTPYDTGVVGVVDAALYVPSPATRATYLAEQQARSDAHNQNSRTLADPSSGPHSPQVHIPPTTISDADGTVHTLEGVTTIPTGSYVNVVTLGSYKAIRVDATFAPIRKGDLLVASPNPGHAMRAIDRTQTSGATIGKALADLPTGTALIPLIVTLK